MTRAPYLLSIMLIALLLACAPRDVSVEAAGAGAGGWPQGNRSQPSPGCRTGPAPPTQGTVEVRGRERALILRVPNDYRGERARELIIAFHGRTNPNSQVQGYFDLDEELPEAVIVYPSALPDGSGFRWSNPGDLPADLRDFLLVERLIESLSRAYCIDLSRVFVVGHSLGASFANSVACHRAGRIRAVASVAGGIEGSECQGGAAALLIHHPDDRLVPVSEGLRARDAFVRANGLPTEPVPASEPQLRALACVRHGPDSPDPVIWCAHDDAYTYGGRYYPHNWPDAAAPAIARFFADLP